MRQPPGTWTHLCCDQTDVVCDLSENWGVICVCFEASATACHSHPGSRRWRNLYAASLNLSSLLTSYSLCSRCLASLDGSVSCFSLVPWHVVLLPVASCKSQLSPHSSVIEDIYLSHSPATRTLSYTEVRGSLQLTTDSGEGREIMLPLVYSLSVSFSFHRSGPFAPFFPALIIDGLSSAAELETRAIDWPPNRHGFLLKVVKNLPWLMAKHFLEASRSGGGMKRWVARSNNWY